MLHEWYDAWAVDPAPGQVHTGLYHDSASGYWTGWDIVHDFAPNHWTTFDFSPGIYWGSIGALARMNYGDGLVCMWAPMNNVKFAKACHDQVRLEGRPVMANLCPGYESAMDAPWLDMMGSETGVLDSTHQTPATSIQDQSLMRVVAGAEAAVLPVRLVRQQRQRTSGDAGRDAGYPALRHLSRGGLSGHEQRLEADGV